MTASSICIVYGNRPLISETFLAAHLERLTGEKVVLYNYFPEYTYQGRTLRYFYSQRPWLMKAKRMLPQFLYDRWVTRHEHSAERTRDFILAFLKQHRVDVILAEYGFNGADITPYAQELGIPLVVHFHGHDAHREPELQLYCDRYREMFDYARCLVSVSHTMTAALVRMGADESKIVYNPYGAREYFFDIEPDYRPTLLAVGRFADIKAPYLTLMAFKFTADRIPEARLVMVGDGPLLETCKSLVTMWGLTGRVEFKGALPHSEALPLFSQACGFVQHSVTTSYGDSEGMPNSILEAGAAKLPVIATRHAGISTAVIEGVTGFLVEERDVHGMAEKMCTLLANREHCRRMGAYAREHIRQHYHISRHVQGLQDVINETRELSKEFSA
jgi:colanic acid/amylovoran biosynthesis glycosyltransferase